MPFKAAAGERKLGQGLALVVADNQIAALERPLATGEKIARTAALRRDRTLGRAGHAAKIHEATAAAGRGQSPAPGEINRRRCWRRRWRRRRRGLRWRLG